MAISDIAKSPFRRIRKTRIRICSVMLLEFNSLYKNKLLKHY
jgi:hypothetical protein